MNIKTDWMVVNVANMAVAAEIFKRDGFTLIELRLHGVSVDQSGLLILT